MLQLPGLASSGAGRQWPHHSWSGRLQLSGFICRSRGDSGHITRGVGGCRCPGSSAGAGRQWPHHSWSGRLQLSGFICRSRETVATSLVEWEAASVRVHLPEQGDSGHITRGVGGCICPGSSAGAGRQWPHHSWRWEAASVRVHLPEQGDSGHITRGVGGCICPGSSAGAGRQWPHHSWSGRLHLSGFICRSRETVATSLVEWEAASVRVHLPEQGDSGHLTRGVGGCICPCVCQSRETVATSLMGWEAASVHASAGAGRQWPHHSWSVDAASVQGHIPGGMQDCIWCDQVAACSTCITCTT